MIRTRGPLGGELGQRCLQGAGGEWPGKQSKQSYRKIGCGSNAKRDMVLGSGANPTRAGAQGDRRCLTLHQALVVPRRQGGAVELSCCEVERDPPPRAQGNLEAHLPRPNLSSLRKSRGRVSEDH